MAEGFVVWFTGLSGAGKSTLAAMLSAALRARGVHVEVLDGDEVRTHLSKGLGFSREDRDTNVRRIGYVAKLCARSGACAMSAAISPYRAVRDEIRAQIDRFVEVYCRCDIPVLAERDPKGLYKKALAGEIKNFTGIDDPYEPPLAPEITVDTSAETKEESLARILARLEELGYVPKGEAPRELAARAPGGPAALVGPHGGELVSRLVKGEEREALCARAASLPAVTLDEAAARDLEGLATGALSPLKGFMNSKDFLRVVREMRLENGLPWPLPVTLAVSEQEAGALAVGASVALLRDGARVAVLEVSDVYRPAAALAAQGDLAGLDAEARALAPEGAVFVGGEVRVLARAAGAEASPGDPQALRAWFTERGAARVVGFCAEGIFSRADEHATRAALESADALLLQVPAFGAASGSARSGYPVEVRRRCCEAVVSRYVAEGRAVVAACGATRGAGARAAVLRAITQKNHGCSQVVIALGELGSLAALGVRRAFAAFAPGELGVEPLFFDEVLASRRVGGIATARSAPREPDDAVLPGGGPLEAMLLRGDAVSDELVRPEVRAIVHESGEPQGRPLARQG